MLGKHDHGDSRLSCVDCGEIICSKCFVQCPVGFRCKKCGDVKNPLTSVSSWLVIKALCACTAVGCLGAWILTFVHVPYIDCIVAFVLGILFGRFLAKVIDYKLGRAITTTIVFGVLIGMCFSPFLLYPMIIIEFLTKPFTDPASGYTLMEALNDVVSSLFVPVCYMIGILRSTVWGSR